MKAFDIGVKVAMDKMANPAQPVKKSLPSGSPEAQRFAPYLNQGGGQAAQHQAGCVESKPQPWPGHVNVGDKRPGVQVAGDINVHASPDTGDKGTSDSGDMVRTKSAAFEAGLAAVFADGDED